MSPLRGELRMNEPMAAHTSWRAGGPADRWYHPADLEDLAAFLRGLPADEPLTFIGLGSNLLVRDGGIRGTVISLKGVLGMQERIAEDRLRLGAGVSCPAAARLASDEGLSGLEFMAGIPGTIGGALAMNAGAFGAETWARVVAVETIDRHGTIRRRLPSDYSVDFRTACGPEGEWFVSAEFRLDRNGGAQARARVRELLERRARLQPIGKPSCGSVFRNPPGDHAGRLIEAAGLKGLRVGGAVVSEKHANFIINEGNATAADIEALIDLVQARVRESQCVVLEPEVCILGEAA